MNMSKNKLTYLHFFLYVIFITAITYIDDISGLQGMLTLPVLLLISFFFVKKPLGNILPNTRKYNNLPYIITGIISVIIFHAFFVITVFSSQDDKLFFYEENDTLFLIKMFALFPFMEELVFRRCFLDSLLKHSSLKKAVFLTSLGFALCHIFSDSGLLPVFMVSVFLGLVYTETKSLLLCFLFHSLANILAYMVSIYRKDLLFKFSTEWSVIIIVFSLLLIVASAIAIFKNTAKDK
ncbi:CPBP family intramembrane glutamic endopeptidase [Sinomicrobium pectinilyticum]|nr:CPBP family intramembrane glutamic endopeptidase [Sinomicrobium pectinilyticum]